MSPQDFVATGKLDTRETVIQQIKDRVTADLYTGEGKRGPVLNGPLGEQIAFASGCLDLNQYVTAEQVAEGICNWLDKYFLQSPQGFGPRENEGAGALPGSPDAASCATPNSGGAQGSRASASDLEAV